MDITEIMRMLPHRYPLLLVDRVLECDGENRIVALKNLTATEPVFQGHFPGNPVMPGVYQLEAMAQAAGILLNQRTNCIGGVAYFLAVDKARFRRVLVPGDQLIITVEMLRLRSNMCRVQGTIKVGDELACEAEMMFGRKE